MWDVRETDNYTCVNGIKAQLLTDRISELKVWLDDPWFLLENESFINRIIVWWSHLRYKKRVGW